MKAAKYLFAIWAGVLIYTLLSVSFGAMGVSAQGQLEKEQKKQEENVAALKQINLELEDTVNSLLYDKDTLAVYAREQGFASEKERFIRIVGLGLSQKNKTQAGSVVFAAEPQYAPDQTIRIIAFCIGITVFICMAAFDFLKSFREK